MVANKQARDILHRLLDTLGVRDSMDALRWNGTSTLRGEAT
jgi:hypothetical protein